jgi:hypothetical protein
MTTARLLRLAQRLVVAGLAAGCSPPSTAPIPTTPPVPPPAATPAAAPAGPIPFDPAIATATLLVRTNLKGEPPRMRPIKFDQDAECMKLHTEPVLEETVVCDGGRLANVIAFVSRGAERWTYAAPKDPALLDQRGCMYVPHVLTVMTHQTIAVRNSDPTMHNVHVTRGVNEYRNHCMLFRAKDLSFSFAKPEVAVKFKCDVHGWMNARVGVFAHPFHGVTDRDGRIALRVPPGDYEVSVWHEYDRFTKPAPRAVTVAGNGTAEVEFEFAAAPR